MTYIFAMTGDPMTEWVAIGHTREVAEAVFKTNRLLFAKPLYRIVARRR